MLRPTKTWVLSLLLSIFLLTPALADIPKPPSADQLAPIPKGTPYFFTKAGFGVKTPYWLPAIKEVREELIRVIDEMWKRHSKKFDTSHMDPKKMTIYIHKRMGSFRYPKLAGKWKGLAWVEVNKIIVAWTMDPRTQDIDYKKTLSTLYHEWAHFDKAGPGSDHKGKRWKVVKELEKKEPVHWMADFLPKPPLIVELHVIRPAGRRSDLPSKPTTR